MKQKHLILIGLALGLFFFPLFFGASDADDAEQGSPTPQQLDVLRIAIVSVWDGQMAELLYVQAKNACVLRITGAGDEKVHVKHVPCPNLRDFFGVRGLPQPQHEPMPQPRKREWSA